MQITMKIDLFETIEIWKQAYDEGLWSLTKTVLDLIQNVDSLFFKDGNLCGI